MNTGGWIPFRRSLLQDDLAPAIEGREYTRFEAWLYLCCQAVPFEEGSMATMVGRRPIRLGMGELLTSYSRLQRDWKWGSIGKVQRFIDSLVGRGVVERVSSRPLVLSIVRERDYKAVRKDDEHEGGKATTSAPAGPAHTYNKKRKEEHKEANNVIHATDLKSEGGAWWEKWIEERAPDEQLDWLRSPRTILRLWNHLVECHDLKPLQYLCAARVKGWVRILESAPGFWKRLDAELSKRGSYALEKQWPEFDWLIESTANLDSFLEGKLRGSHNQKNRKIVRNFSGNNYLHGIAVSSVLDHDLEDWVKANLILMLEPSMRGLVRMRVENTHRLRDRLDDDQDGAEKIAGD